MIPKLTASLDFHGQALMLRAERQRLIAGNIANADTPGFKARDFDFASALRSATAGMAGASGMTAKSGASDSGTAIGAGIADDVMASGGGGGGGGGSGSGSQPSPILRYAMPAQTNLDSNSVDMDRERAAFAHNATQYEATLRFISGQVRTTLDAMKSHNQG
jgi:flagellar basal-body rod protein FlgB